jgi:hypothetical protein
VRTNGRSRVRNERNVIWMPRIKASAMSLWHKQDK